MYANVGGVLLVHGVRMVRVACIYDQLFTNFFIVAEIHDLIWALYEYVMATEYNLCDKIFRQNWNKSVFLLYSN